MKKERRPETKDDKLKINTIQGDPEVGADTQLRQRLPYNGSHVQKRTATNQNVCQVNMGIRIFKADSGVFLSCDVATFCFVEVLLHSMVLLCLECLF